MRRLLAILGAIALSACDESPRVQATVVPELTKPVAAVKLYAMDCGRFHVKDAASFSDEHVYDGQARDLVDPCYLIRHPRGDMMWDAGVPPAMAAEPQDKTARATVTLKETLEQQLAELGVAPSDIDYFAISHSHYDHVGSAALFKDATWIVDKDERDWMFRDEARQSPNFPDIAPLETMKTTLIEGDGDFDVFGDGSAIIVQAPGHTPGHTVLLLNTANSGKVLLAGDMWHLAEAREKRTVPQGNVDRAQTLASMDKVEALAESTSARVIRQHVPEDFNSLPKFPKALE
ncbi:MAG TPA: N-acyl homoserine lactonase family protein [Hyphomonadaceae bacterium]|nr:N-acyl homoserine lactonase family protein [Hyphomonadaceae bacterium]